MAEHLNLTIRPEGISDFGAVAAVHTAAFGGDEPICDLVTDLRAMMAPLPTVSLVAEIAGQVVGHIMLSHTWLDADAVMVDIYTLSPLGITPDHQGQGIGKALITAAIDAAGQADVDMVVLEGNPKYYRGSGFVPAGEYGLRRPSHRIPEKAFQVYRINDAAAHKGTVVMRDVFWMHDCVGLRK